MVKNPKGEVVNIANKKDENWSELYNYVKKHIMDYDDNQKLTQNMVLRLKGLADGKFMANKNHKSLAKYSYLVVLLTFKYCRLDIKNSIKSKNFNDDWHKFLYISKVIENNLNYVYARYMENLNTQEKFKSIEVNLNTKSNYKKKTTENKYSKKQEYW